MYLINQMQNTCLYIPLGLPPPTLLIVFNELRFQEGHTLLIEKKFKVTHCPSTNLTLQM